MLHTRGVHFEIYALHSHLVGCVPILAAYLGTDMTDCESCAFARKAMEDWQPCGTMPGPQMTRNSPHCSA